jgi:tetratricopeptide (TPR) repeat protein
VQSHRAGVRAADATELQRVRTGPGAGDRAGAASRKLTLHNTLGILHFERDDFLASFRHYDAALRVCRSVGDRVHEGLMLNCLGLALARLQRYDEARTVLEEGVAVNRDTRERRLEAHALTALPRSRCGSATRPAPPTCNCA